MEQIIERPIRQRRSRQQIAQLLEEFERSKVSVKDFCKQHHISSGNFHKWKSRYRGRTAGKKMSPGFTAIDIVRPPHDASQRLFAEVKGIKIYQPVDASFLKELMA
jgi:transposase-like protein